MIRPIPSSGNNKWEVREEDMRGMVIRFEMLQTHYRKEKAISAAAYNNAAKAYRKLLSKCVPNSGPVPVPVLEALCDDLNTPQAIAELHKLAKSDPLGLFAAMKLLGLIPGCGALLDYGMAQEIKTIPIDHLPLPIWGAFEVN